MLKPMLKQALIISIVAVLLLGNTVNSAWASPLGQGTTPPPDKDTVLCSPSQLPCSLNTGTANIKITAISKACKIIANPYTYSGSPPLPVGLHPEGQGVEVHSKASCGVVTMQARICFPIYSEESQQIYKQRSGSWQARTSFFKWFKVCTQGAGFGTYLPLKP